MNSDPVLLERSQPAWRLTLNRPDQGNACSSDLVRGLDAALTEAEAEQVPALIIRSKGRHFCTGFDLSGLEHETDDSLLARFVQLELMLQRIARAPFLTVAVAQGRAIGAGADLFAACRLRLAESNTSFAFPGARGFGLVLGTRRLATRVGAETALEWVETGRTISLQEACSAGLVSGAVAESEGAEGLIAARMGADATLRTSIRRAVEPAAEAEDACDLALLVRSAARAGLRDRIAAYLESVAMTRRSAVVNSTRA